MKFSAIIGAFMLVAEMVYAQSWSVPVLKCDQALVEDICWSNGFNNQCRRQLIVWGNDAKNYFLRTSMYPANYKNELIIPELQFIPHSSDLVDKSLAYRYEGRVVYVKPRYDKLTVESFYTTQATGGHYSQGDLVGSYTFNNCH